MLPKYRKHIPWIIYVILSAFAGLFFYLFPQLGESIYGMRIYPLIRSLYDIVLSSFSQSLALFLIVLLLFALVKNIATKGFIYGLKFILVLIAHFYWLWGFNYYRTDISDENKMDIPVAPFTDSLHLEITNQTLNNCIALSEAFMLNNNESYDHSLLQSCFELADEYSFLAKAKLEPVPIYPKSIFLRIGILGMYFPYSGQAQYEIELGAIDRPFTIAHEWCHSAGVGPEYEADFLAYLICMSNDNRKVRYSAQMHLLYELLFYYKISDRKEFERMISKFTPIMKKHIEERKEKYEKYNGPISEMSDEMIDRYLKLQNQEGISDYHRLSEFVLAWEEKNRN
jgi:hypothetical protein